MRNAAIQPETEGYGATTSKQMIQCSPMTNNGHYVKTAANL